MMLVAIMIIRKRMVYRGFQFGAQAMELDAHAAAERCTVEMLPGGPPHAQRFMVDRLEDKVTCPPWLLRLKVS